MKNWPDILKNDFDHPAIVFWRAVELSYIDAAIEKKPLNEPILDLGCAEGKIAGAIFKNNKIIGLDNCWELLKENKCFDVYKGLILGDGCHMPYKNEVFASVFSNCVIEHISDLDSVLSEISRVLKDDGVFLFTVPSHKFSDFLFFSVIFDNLSLKFLADWYKKKRNSMLHHYHCYDDKRWKEILKVKKLDLIGYKYYMNKRFTFIWDLLVIIVFIFRSVYGLRSLLPELNNLLSKFINISDISDSTIGAGLLLIAKKTDINYELG